MTVPNGANLKLARAVVVGRGAACSHFWPGVRSAGPWLSGGRGEPSGPARSTDGQR